jgi:signal transduction histidine kinase/CHASE3 domain sensor protein
LIHPGKLAVDTVSRVPARVQTKLLVAFLAMVALIVLLGAVGLRVLSGMNERTEELIELQRKIAAYRHVQHDTTRQLYGVSSALLSEDDRALDSVLRQLSQFGYDLDRLQYVAQDEVELLGEVRADYDRFIGIVTEAVERARAGQVTEARELQRTEARPLADRLERLTNQLVNVAEADALERIEASQHAYDTSRMVVVGLALGSIVLALGLGYVFSWSIVGPLTQIAGRLRKIAAGEFAERVDVINRDELGALAADVNRTSEELGSLYRQVEERTAQLQRSVAELEALGEVGRAVSASLDLDTVLRSIIANACSLARADGGTVHVLDEASDRFEIAAELGMSAELTRLIQSIPAHSGSTLVGRAALRREAVQIEDAAEAEGYTPKEAVLASGIRALLAVPMLREDHVIGALVVTRNAPGAFSAETIELLKSFAGQSALAIHNAKLFEELERKGRELEEASRHKSEFLANMSHELRTPLNAVLGYAELIQDGIYGDVPDKIQDVLERIQQNGRHLLGLINDVLDLSKIEAGQLTLSPIDYSMRELVLDVVSATEALAAEKRLALEVDVPADLPLGRGDERRLTQVLMNLVSNAIKFTETGSVSIRAKVEDGSFVVRVADTGMGIADQDLERIFGEFQQVDSSSTRKTGGTGLGLAIARRIVEMHGGRIWVESTPGAGSTFYFTVPQPAASPPERPEVQMEQA